MRKKKHCSILMIALLIAIAVICSGCAKQLEQPVFVKNLICSSDMDTAILFITNNKCERYVEDIEIPDMPEHMRLQFYDEQIEDFSKYDIHVVNFGVATDELNEDSSLKNDFVFHEMIVKWDDGSKTRANIGTIHMTPNHQSFILKTDSSSSSSDGRIVEQRKKYIVNENMSITCVKLPYEDQLSNIITELSANGLSATDITEMKPLQVNAGEAFELSYTIDYDAAKVYGELFLEGIITGVNEKGKPFEDVFHVVDSHGRWNDDWIERQIADVE